jgi:uncharacterized protein (TIGR02594 family)
MNVTLYQIAERFMGLKEIPGSEHNPQVMAMLHLDQEWPEGDEVPWCSAFVNYCAWLLNLPRSKSLRARSWLNVGVPVDYPRQGFDVAILNRGEGEQPGPDVIDAPGHVGLFASAGSSVWLLGGNQGNTVSVAPYDRQRVLGIRRLRCED